MVQAFHNNNNNVVFIGIIVTVFLAGLSGVIHTADGEVASPRQQIDEGVSVKDIICKERLELVVRNNGSPACVKPQTAQKMQEMDLLSSDPIKFTNLDEADKSSQATQKEEKEVQSVPASDESITGFTDLNDADRSFQATQEEIQTIPASTMSVVNFYITDDDLNIAHSAAEVISTKGLFEFTINGIPIEGPKNMIETGLNTGKFYVKLELPKTIDGRPPSQDDIILIKYLDESDYSGEKRVIVKSIPLAKTFAKVQTSGGGGSRIGHEFVVRIYEPDANRDSRNEDKIPLTELEYRGDGGIRTTLANPKFDANSSHLIETGPNSNIFEVQIKIPRQLDGKTIHIGDEYEIRYIDKSTPSNTNEKIILKGKIG